MSVGVLITYYNEKELLTECLESLRGQTESVDEIVVYDDESQYPARDYVPSDLAVRVIRGSVNRGPSFGRNALIHASSSDYLHFQDADDWFAQTWAEEVKARVAATDPDVVFTELSAYRDGKCLTEHMVGMRRLAVSKDLLRFSIQEVMQPATGTYRKSTLLKIGGYSTALWQSEDYEFHIRLALNGVKFEIIDRPLVNVRLHAGNRSNEKVELNSDAVACLRMHGPQVPADYRNDVAEALAMRGRRLYQLGAVNAAKIAFDGAYELGIPAYADCNAAYRSIARSLGPSAAEWSSKMYRTVLPAQLRQRIASLGPRVRATGKSIAAKARG